MFERGGYGIARGVALFGMAAAVVGCATAPSSPSASATAANSSRHFLAAPAVPAAVGSHQPRLPAPATAASMIGLSTTELFSLLGAPEWTRRESPALVWQYQGATCVVDLYLYEENGTAHVLYAEARGEAAQPITLTACLERIKAERRPATPAS